jgi:hypothetical protein
MKKKLALRTTAALLAAAGGLVALRVAPSSAVPFPPDITIQSEFLPVGTPPTASNQMTKINAGFGCPSGTGVIGNGFGPGVDSMMPGSTTISVTSPPSVVTFWGRATFGGPGKPPITPFAEVVCAPLGQLTDMTIVEKTSPAQPGTWGRTEVSCPAGRYALNGGGGFGKPNGGGLVWLGSDNLLASAPTGDGKGWVVTAGAPVGATTMKVRVLCEPELALAHTMVQVITEAAPPGAGLLTLKSAYATCPAGYTAASGGYQVLTGGASPGPYLPDPHAVVGAFPQYSVQATTTTGSSWYASAELPGRSIPGAPDGTKLSVRAVCVATPVQIRPLGGR